MTKRGRWCEVCGPQAKPGEPSIVGCVRCGSKVGHCHVVVVGRDGTPVGLVAVCADHTPPAGSELPDGLHVAVERRAGVPRRSDVKRRRDRERRQAQKVVLDRHRDELAEVLQQIRRGS